MTLYSRIELEYSHYLWVGIKPYSKVHTLHVLKNIIFQNKRLRLSCSISRVYHRKRLVTVHGTHNIIIYICMYRNTDRYINHNGDLPFFYSRILLFYISIGNFFLSNIYPICVILKCHTCWFWGAKKKYIYIYRWNKSIIKPVFGFPWSLCYLSLIDWCNTKRICTKDSSINFTWRTYFIFYL